MSLTKPYNAPHGAHSKFHGDQYQQPIPHLWIDARALESSSEPKEHREPGQEMADSEQANEALPAEEGHLDSYRQEESRENHFGFECFPESKWKQPIGKDEPSNPDPPGPGQGEESLREMKRRSYHRLLPNPILEPEVEDSLELAGVVGDQAAIQGKGMGGDQGIQRPDRCTFGL